MRIECECGYPGCEWECERVCKRVCVCVRVCAQQRTAIPAGTDDISAGTKPLKAERMPSVRSMCISMPNVVRCVGSPTE